MDRWVDLALRLACLMLFIMKGLQVYIHDSSTELGASNSSDGGSGKIYLCSSRHFSLRSKAFLLCFVSEYVSAAFYHRHYDRGHQDSVIPITRSIVGVEFQPVRQTKDVTIVVCHSASA